MAQQSTVDIAKALTNAYNDKDWDRFRELVTSSFVYDEVGTHRRVQGPDAVLAVWKGWSDALPNSVATFDNTTASGNTVVLELTWRGTHTGALQTPEGAIPPTGRSVELRAVQVVEVANDRAQSMRHYFDLGTIMQQLGT